MPGKRGANDRTALANLVRAQRAARGLTQEQLARRSGLRPNYVSAIETGRANPSFTSLSALASGLGLDVFELIGRVASRR